MAKRTQSYYYLLFQISRQWNYFLNSLALYFARGIITIFDILTETTKAILIILQNKYIAIPATKKWKNIANRFNDTWNMPNCVGAMKKT